MRALGRNCLPNRHAVNQAELCRQFILTASPLKDWLDRYELDQAACRAAVVGTDFTPAQVQSDARLNKVCHAFDVDLICVPRHIGGLHDERP